MNPQPDLGLAAKNCPVAVVLYIPLTTQNRMGRYQAAIPRLSFRINSLSQISKGLAATLIVRLE
jgi:hypothetical protein